MNFPALVSDFIAVAGSLVKRAASSVGGWYMKDPVMATCAIAAVGGLLAAGPLFSLDFTNAGVDVAGISVGFAYIGKEVISRRNARSAREYLKQNRQQLTP